MTLVLAIDPGLSRSSCAMACVIVDGRHRAVRAAHAIMLARADDIDARMQDVTTTVADAIVGVDLLVLEDQQPAAFVAKGRQNKHSARLQELVRMLQGVALVMGKPCVVVTPQKVREVLGLKRGATKEQVWWTVSGLLGRSHGMVTSPHVRDALALAVAGEKVWSADQRIEAARAARGAG